MSPLRLGTRASELATSQSGWVADQLRALGHQVELVLVQTEGDRNSAPLTQIGGTGVFVSALREALLAGEIDVAVHSLKDLPVGEASGLVLAAIPEREDPRDVLISAAGQGLADLPVGAVVGTGSPRRAVQLWDAAPHLRVHDIRGNVGRRIGLVADGEVDAVVLAAAGLRRLGRIGEATQVLGLDVMLPAPGQGALAVECRANDQAVRDLLAPLDHLATRRCVTAERALLAGLEAGCSAPVGALATLEGEELVLSAVVGPAESITGSPAPAYPASADPASADLASADPASADLASADLASADLASADPAPADLASADPASADQAPADPAPSHPQAGAPRPSVGLLRHALRGTDPDRLGRQLAEHFLTELAMAPAQQPDLTPAAQPPGA